MNLMNMNYILYETLGKAQCLTNPFAWVKYIKTRKLGFTKQKIRTQFSPPILSEAISNIFAVLLADLVRNVRDSTPHSPLLYTNLLERQPVIS